MIPNIKKEQTREEVEATTRYSSGIEESKVQQSTSGARRRPKFQGSGPGGRVVKEDLRKWSNILHASQPPNLYGQGRVPYRTIAFVSARLPLTHISELLLVYCWNIIPSYELQRVPNIWRIESPS